MANLATFRLTLPPIALLNPAQAREVLAQELGQGVATVIEAIATEARANTPVGVSGNARSSIGTLLVRGEDAGTLVRGSVFSGAQAPYFQWLEFGSSPHWPPSAPIKVWAARVLGDEKLWFVVARAIARRGTKALHIFDNAAKVVEPSVQGTMDAAMARAATRLVSEAA